MATTQHSEFSTYKAASDFTGDRYKFVEQTADDTVELANASTDDIIGVIVEEVTAGKPCAIQRIDGGATFKVVLGATLSRGALVTSNASGVAVAPTAGQRGHARLLQGGVSGDIVEARGGVETVAV